MVDSSSSCRSSSSRRNGVRFNTALQGQQFKVDLTLVGSELQGEIRGSSGPPLSVALIKLPDYETPHDRSEAWAQDLEVVRTRFLRFDRSFAPESRIAAARALDELATQSTKLSDPQIIARLSEIVASSGNAHTRLYLLRNRTALRRMPIRLHWFRDGLFVIRATEASRDLLGCRLEAIEDTVVAQAQARVARLFAGNTSWQRYKGPYFLTSPEILNGIGIASQLERILYHFDCAGNAAGGATGTATAQTDGPADRSLARFVPAVATHRMAPRARAAAAATALSAPPPAALLDATPPPPRDAVLPVQPLAEHPRGRAAR